LFNKMMHRYEINHEFYKNLFISKLPYFQRREIPVLKHVIVHAGLYKISSMLPEYSIILSSLTGVPCELNYQVHGKRRKRTMATTATLKMNKIWYFLDKFLHEFIPHMFEFETPKIHKSIIINNYSLRVRQKFALNPEFEDLVENFMYDTHRGIYLPLTVHFKLKNSTSSFIDEIYLRMLRIPFSLYSRRARPAFDDRPSLKK